MEKYNKKAEWMDRPYITWGIVKTNYRRNNGREES